VKALIKFVLVTILLALPFFGSLAIPSIALPPILNGQIEENADNVWMMFRDDYYNNDVVSKSRYSLTDILYRKTRTDSAAGDKSTLAFDTAQQWFYRKSDVGIVNVNDYTK
jgi:hypothetical protein